MRLSEIRIAGFGGQGVILSAMIIGKASSIYEGGFATMTQSFGPEARGGACSAQVILSDEPIHYPYVTRSDILVVLSQEAYARFSPGVREGGLLIVEQDLVRVGELKNGIRVQSIPATRFAEELGKRIVLNVVMVGFFGAVSGAVDPEALRRAVADSVTESSREINRRAFEKGYEYGLLQVQGVVGAGEADEGQHFFWKG